MVRNHDNVSRWGDMSNRILGFFQWASTFKIQQSMFV